MSTACKALEIEFEGLSAARVAEPERERAQLSWLTTLRFLMVRHVRRAAWTILDLRTEFKIGE